MFPTVDIQRVHCQENDFNVCSETQTRGLKFSFRQVPLHVLQSGEQKPPTARSADFTNDLKKDNCNDNVLTGVKEKPRLLPAVDILDWKMSDS